MLNPNHRLRRANICRRTNGFGCLHSSRIKRTVSTPPRSDDATMSGERNQSRRTPWSAATASRARPGMPSAIAGQSPCLRRAGAVGSCGMPHATIPMASSPSGMTCQ